MPVALSKRFAKKKRAAGLMSVSLSLTGRPTPAAVAQDLANLDAAIVNGDFKVLRFNDAVRA